MESGSSWLDMQNRKREILENDGTWCGCTEGWRGCCWSANEVRRQSVPSRNVRGIFPLNAWGHSWVKESSFDDSFCLHLVVNFVVLFVLWWFCLSSLISYFNFAIFVRRNKTQINLYFFFLWWSSQISLTRKKIAHQELNNQSQGSRRFQLKHCSLFYPSSCARKVLNSHHSLDPS